MNRSSETLGVVGHGDGSVEGSRLSVDGEARRTDRRSSGSEGVNRHETEETTATPQTRGDEEVTSQVQRGLSKDFLLL